MYRRGNPRGCPIHDKVGFRIAQVGIVLYPCVFLNSNLFCRITRVDL